MADQSGKTEKATQQKREDEQKKGNLFQSKDVTGALTLVAAVFALRVAGPSIYDGLREVVIRGSLSGSFTGEMSAKTASLLFADMVYAFLRMFAPIGLITAAVSLVAGGAQTRFRFTASLLKPKFSRMNPIAGVRKMFSAKSLVDLFKSLVKLAVIALVVYGEVEARFAQVVALPLAGLEAALFWMAEASYRVVMKIALLMAVFAAADYLYQWWSYEKSIRMTKQEVRDEMKRMEGDPHVKGRIREIQRKMAAMRMMGMVAKADVVVRNPTHYAVALQYDPQKDSAPVVVAKGQGHLALRIIKEAEKHGVWITENRPLARGLYESVDVNGRIPEQFYKAVAELIAYLYQIKHKRMPPAAGGGQGGIT